MTPWVCLKKNTDELLCKTHEGLETAELTAQHFAAQTGWWQSSVSPSTEWPWLLAFLTSVYQRKIVSLVREIHIYRTHPTLKVQLKCPQFKNKCRNSQINTTSNNKRHKGHKIKGQVLPPQHPFLPHPDAKQYDSGVSKLRICWPEASNKDSLNCPKGHSGSAHLSFSVNLNCQRIK